MIDNIEEEIKEEKNEITSENIEENINEEREKKESLIDGIKSKGVIDLIEKVGEKVKKKRLKIIEPDKIKEKINKILLKGILMKIYMWISRKSNTSFKSIESKNQQNFKIDSFRNIISKSYIENEIEENMTILDLSNFNNKEVNIIEDFCTKFKEGKLQKEIDKIKKGIDEEKQKKIKNDNINNENNDIINTNSNNDIIINNNKEDNFDKDELENVEVEYNLKRGGTEININTIKFKQFYYLLETNVFKKYFSSSYLIKTIFSILGSFLSNNFDYLIYIIMIIDNMINCSILSLFYPLSIFCYALLENPRPKKSYWQVCLYYTIFILIIKFIFQLKLFIIIMEK